MSALFTNLGANFLISTMAQPAIIHSGQNLTMMCWVNLGTNTYSWRAIMCATPNFSIQTNSDGLTPGVSTPGQTGIYAAQPLVEGVWYHICATHYYQSAASHLCQLYVNGQQVSFTRPTDSSPSGPP